MKVHNKRILATVVERRLYRGRNAQAAQGTGRELPVLNCLILAKSGLAR